MKLSIVIPTLNAGRSLPATLAAIAEGGEVVVADGGSTDDTVELVAAGRVDLIRSPRAREGRAAI